MKIGSLLLFFLLSIKAFSFSGPGSGTIGDPYLVSSASLLDEVRTNLSAYYRQTNDIDLTSFSNWLKIGTSTTAGLYFSGTYDGNGYRIYNLTISSITSNYNGLFGVVGSGGVIKNLRVEGTFTDNTAGYLGNGLLVGYNNLGTIQNCSAHGSITVVGNNSGGLCGSTTGNILDSYSTVNVTAVGLNSTNIDGFCGSTGTLTPTITNCYSTGSVVNNATSAISVTGGFIGILTGSISNCYSSGNVNGGSGKAGGFIGNTGTGNKSVTNSYCSPNSISGAVRGGFLGNYNTGTFTSCYFDEQKTGLSSVYGTIVSAVPTNITGKSTLLMKTASTFSGWDFSSVWELVGPEGTFYPRLRSNPEGLLPVELQSFNIKSSANSVSLIWQTLTEKNNYGFAVERKTTSSNWQQIAFLQGNGNSNSIKNYSFVDNNVTSNVYQYRLKQIDNSGEFTFSQVLTADLTASLSSYNLLQNYPNPFNPSTVISYSIAEGGPVSLVLYDALGREVQTLINENKEAGSYSFNLNAINLSAGVYYYTLKSGGYTKTQKMILMK